MVDRPDENSSVEADPVAGSLEDIEVPEVERFLEVEMIEEQS